MDKLQIKVTTISLKGGRLHTMTIRIKTKESATKLFISGVGLNCSLPDLKGYISRLARQKGIRIS